MTILDLPLVNACLNGCSAALLLVGYLAIRNNQRELHRRCMTAAFVTSVLFLVGYLTYHFSVQTVTRFRDPAWFRPIYLGILRSHTVLAMVQVPLVLRALFLAFTGRYEAHRRIARWAWPVWMYVSVTGVGIYLLLYQVFPQG